MAVIINSIGSNNRDFTSIQQWFESIPTDVVASGNSYVGELYNDSEFTGLTGQINFTGKTTNASFNITLRCAPGHSFTDHPNRADNPLFYNQSYGVGIRITGAASGLRPFYVRCAYTNIEGIQFKVDTPNISIGSFGGTRSSVKNSMLFGLPSNNINTTNLELLNEALMLNCLVGVLNGSACSAIYANGCTIVNTTVVRPTTYSSANAARGIFHGYNRNTAKNCASFGFKGSSIGTGWYAESTNNATDYTTAPGSKNNKVGLVYENQFVNSANDFRLKPGSDLINAGANLSSEYESIDISNNTRQTLWDIGAAEALEPASALILTGPATGPVGKASSEFEIKTNGVLSSSVLVSLSDGGFGGTFVPATLTLEPNAIAKKFTYTPSSTAGAKTISTNNNGGLDNTSIVFTAVVAATAIDIQAPPGGGRAGEVSPDFIVASNGFLANPVTLTLTDGGDGVFTPNTITLTNQQLSATFKYTAVTEGVKTITVTNNGGLPTKTATYTVKAPIIVRPTPSSETLIVKSIGTGKDYATIGAFASYASSLDLVALKTSVMGEVYEDLQTPTSTNAAGLSPKTGNDQFKVYLQPVPGLSVNELDQGEPLDYGTEGVELSVFNTWRVGRGVEIRNFRVRVGASGTINLGSTNNWASPGTFSRCRVRTTSSAASTFQVGEYTTPGALTDCLIIQESGPAAVISGAGVQTLKRNTFVRRGDATGTPIVVSNSQNSANKNAVVDNAFINCGPAPIANAELLASTNFRNNYSDTALATPLSGITAITSPSLVRNVLNDYRPNPSGGLVGKGSPEGLDSLDLYGINRGGVPDAGAVQGAVVVPLPAVTITNTFVDGQIVTVSGTTKFVPTLGIAVLAPADVDSNGAQLQEPKAVTLGNGTFTVTWENVAAGNYNIPKITMTNSGGSNISQTGGEAISIIPISATIVDGEESASTGNAPTVTIVSAGFDLKTFGIRGTVDTQGDASCTISAYADIENNVSTTPVQANVVGNLWGVQFTNLTGNFIIRLVATANGKTSELKSYQFSVLKATSNISIEPSE